MSLNGWNLIRRWMSAGWNVSFLATSILGIISLAPVNAAERSDRLPERDWIQPQLQALARSSDRSPIHLKSGRFLPIGRVEQNLTAIRATASGENAIHVIVQFDTTPDAASWQSLLAEGVELQGYLPANAFLARVANQTSADRLGRLGVKWVGGIYPEDKVPSRFQSSGIGTWALHPDGSADLRVKYHADVPFETAAEKIQTTGARIIASDRKLGEFTVNATAASVANLSALDCIRWIEEVPPPRMPNNDGIRGNVQAGEVQEEPYDLSGAGVAVGIWDAGDVDTLHGDLTNRVTLAESSGVPHFHSTHVAGTLAGDGTVSLAAGGTDHQWRGVAPAVQIVSYDFQNSVPEHDSAIDTYDVILSQNSWGLTISEFLGNCSLYGDYSSMAPDYDRIATGIYGRALNVVFAAGNLRRGTDTNSCGVGPYGTMGPPSTAKNVIAVGAIHSDDNSMPVFSSWGPLADGRLKPELVAPGAQVTGDHGITSTSPGGSYLVLQGTSMAAPVVSGAIALLTEDFRRLYNNQNPLPGTIKGLLTHTAADLDDETTWYNRGPDYASGYGRLQVRNAVDQLRAGGFLIARVGNAVTNSYQLTADGTATEIRVTLVWDDPAGLENAATALVNDLDLVVLDPNGVRHYPWTLNPINPAAPAVRSAEDHMNVLEQVVADGPVTPGNWTVQVVGHNVPINAPQKYTLVFSPATIPVPSILTVESAAFREDTGGGANGNGVIEPGE
jgi:hypothetical protein